MCCNMIQWCGQMITAQRQVAADLWTKPIGLNHKPACRLPVNYKKIPLRFSEIFSQTVRNF